ncbi:hypothetical protein [Burkholderia cenocepacia]|uniref:hypothetical protein n=1 Tax=Burkholderia cenocepacia TaxID=95486 RepID=UPI00076D8655|nr:hypothetical protein [Burkholderia cenocepacia]KWU26293.1 hypothetical protein AS149_25210 [Burkholderia cenocepacia]
MKQVAQKQASVRNTTFSDNRVGIIDCLNSRTARRVKNQGEVFALERSLPEVFEYILGIAQDGGWLHVHKEMVEVLYQELEQKLAAGVRLSSKTFELYRRLGHKATQH